MIFLIGCIGYLLLYSGKQKVEYEEEVERISAQEIANQDGDGEKGVAKEEDPVEVSTTPTPALTAKTEVTAEETIKDMNILVLNGTKRPGVAGYWKAELENVGYKNVIPATYTKAVEQETVIWAETVEIAKPLLEVFPNARIQVGSIQDGIELQTGVTMPKKNDIYIIIENNDVKM